MKNIYLIGDSIRFGASFTVDGSPPSPGYGKYVAQKLDGVANVYEPNENCRFAQYIQRYLYNWAFQVDTESIDVVHWNTGLWDVLELLGDTPFTPIEFYVDTLRRIHKHIEKLFPNAEIIFATSTPVDESKCPPDFLRRNSTIEQYNAAAAALMAELGVKVNDLYSLAATFDNSMHTDGVHYNEAACNLLADAVIRAIL